MTDRVDTNDSDGVDRGDAKLAAERAHACVTSLPPMDVAGRAGKVRSAMSATGCDALVVSKLENIRWLTGFTGSAAMVVVTPERLVFTTDGRYGTQSEEELADAGVDAERTVSGGGGQKDSVVAVLDGIGRVGLEADSVTWSQQRRWSAEWFPDAEVIATEALIDTLRIIKDEGEIARIEAACAVADAALAQIRGRLDDGLTEAEFGLELDLAMRHLGAEGNSFETIVAAGPNGAMPHHHPGDRVITRGDLVVLDFGALIDGYCSDMTRTIMVGESSETQRRMLDVVAASQRAGVAAVAAGVKVGDVDKACREIIDDSGWGEAFLHSTGHGVGLEIHEEPRVAAGGDATLGVGAVVTVEPGVYLPGHGGVRIEDTVVVTSDGCRPLTLAPKSVTVS